ncbi:MAG: IS30 family transposase [Candidatus Acidiferrales bacterium]
MLYHQVTAEERYTLGLLRRRGLRPATIARILGRHRCTIGRELRRNGTPRDGCYRPQLADWYAQGRHSRSRRNQRFTATDWAQVQELLREDWSPDQVAGWLRRFHVLEISHETIYRYIWADKRAGGSLHQHLRGARKQRRKRYGSYDSRGRLAGKRWITERPPSVASRTELGHWEADTMLGASQAGPCVFSMVERKSGYLLLGQLAQRTSAFVNARARQLIAAQQRPVRTITVDNGTEFHEYAKLERATGTRFYFATPHHAWERGTNENTNGLIRQYLPKRQSMAHLTQHDCNRIAAKLNRRPRKRLGYRTPEDCYAR